MIYLWSLYARRQQQAARVRAARMADEAAAESAKERGNDALKEKNYGEAIKAYSEVRRAGRLLVPSLCLADSWAAGA